MRFNLSTRILHFCMMVAVIYQLTSSVWMIAPEPGKMLGFGTTLFYLHITVFGWAAFILGGVYALMRFYEPNAWGRLVPWFSSSQRANLFSSARKELPGIFKGRLEPPEEKGALAGAVHGFGFILLIGLGVTGIYVSLGLRSDGSMRDDVLLLLDFHEVFGLLIWCFMAAHVFMTLYHVLLGQRKVLDIFQRGRIPWS